MSSNAGKNKPGQPLKFPTPYVKKKTRKGRSLITPDIITIICDRIAIGESLRKTCESIGINLGTFLAFLTKKENIEWFNQYARAQDIRADVLADDVITLADTATSENAHAIRLMVDTRKWVACKLKPKRYGDKIQTEITAGSGPTVLIIERGSQPDGKTIDVEVKTRESKAIENKGESGD